jgi:hypothetical protein
VIQLRVRGERPAIDEGQRLPRIPHAEADLGFSSAAASSTVQRWIVMGGAAASSASAAAGKVLHARHTAIAAKAAQPKLNACIAGAVPAGASADLAAAALCCGRGGDAEGVRTNRRPCIRVWIAIFSLGC